MTAKIPRIVFEVTGEYADSPDAPNHKMIVHKVVPFTDLESLVAHANVMTEIYLEQCREFLMNILDIQSTRTNFLSKILNAINSYHPDSFDGSILFKDSHTNESCYKTSYIIRVETE